MRLKLAIIAVVTANICSDAITSAFTISSPITNKSLGVNAIRSDARLFSTSTKPCDVPEGAEELASASDLTSQKGAANILRNAVVMNADGDFVNLGKAMGKGTSVVVFLRHMG